MAESNSISAPIVLGNLGGEYQYGGKLPGTVELSVRTTDERLKMHRETTISRLWYRDEKDIKAFAMDILKRLAQECGL